ncbi:hypothetical protein H0H87_009862 [Tephrocybe sp. NHM501043]|nr:hypothetical protein H0H87_009862 [Tephrocybe sp. NHM501043]
MTAQYTPPEGQSLDKPTLYDALATVVEAHPALGIRLSQDPTQDPTFERVGKVDLSEVVEFSSDTNLEAAMQAQLSRKFDFTSNFPLWRVIVLGNGTICFAWHHGIGDGKSGLAFHCALFASLQKGESRGGSHIVIPSDGPLVPGIETLASLSPSWRRAAAEIFSSFAPVSWTCGASAWTGSAVPLTITLQNQVRVLEFTPNVVSQLLILCRSKNATITSTFHTLAISVISGLIVDEEYETISSGVPISLRGISQTADNVICDQVSGFSAYTKVNPVFSWEDASQYANDLRTHVEKSPEQVGMLKLLFGKYDAFFLGKLGKKRQIGLELSNVGRFDAKSDPWSERKWSIGRMAFAQCDVVVGAALKMNVVGDTLGGITVSVVWGANSVSDAFAHAFVANFGAGVEKLLRDEEFVTSP